MSVGVPTTEWRRTSGNGELGTTDENLVTDSGLQLVTLSGLSLVTLTGTYTPVPANVWGTVETVPASVWRKTSGLDDSNPDGPNNIDDTLGNLLVDTAGNFVVDTGIEMPGTPTNTWEENDAI